MTLTDALKQIEVLEREVEQWKAMYIRAIRHDHRVILQLQTYKSLDRHLPTE